MSTRTTKFRLWGGPDCGREVVLSPGQYRFFIPGPPVDDGFVRKYLPDFAPQEGDMRVYKGVYEFSSLYKRLDWKGYTL